MDDVLEATDRLQSRLRRAAVEGHLTPCQVDPRPFTSDDDRERAEAAAACTWCPGRVECAAYAIAANEMHHVWGGVDLTVDGRNVSKRAHLRAQLLEVTGSTRGDPSISVRPNP